MKNFKNFERKVVIIGYGGYLPSKVLTNHDLSKILDTSDDWIFSRTGIKKRHIADDSNRTSDIASIALRNAMLTAQIDSADTLDGIIVATTTPDLIFPATANRVQQLINMKHGFSFDLQAVCSGFLYALNVAASMIITGQANTIAVIGADIMSRVVNWNDRATCVLFGDGAGAVIIQASNHYSTSGFIDFELFSDGTLIDILKANGGIFDTSLSGITMDGKEVYKHAVNHMTRLSKMLLDRNDLSIDDVDWFIPHQANHRIMLSVAQHLGLSQCKIVSTIEEHANTSAATIPLSLEQYMREKKIKKGDLLLMASAGAGMAFGSALVRI